MPASLVAEALKAAVMTLLGPMAVRSSVIMVVKFAKSAVLPVKFMPGNGPGYSQSMSIPSKPMAMSFWQSAMKRARFTGSAAISGKCLHIDQPPMEAMAFTPLSWQRSMRPFGPDAALNGMGNDGLEVPSVVFFQPAPSTAYPAAAAAGVTSQSGVISP